MVTWCISAVNRASLSLRATSRTRSSPLGTPGPALCPGRVESSVFPLAGRLPSTASAAGPPALFGRFAGTTRPSDFPCPCISGLPPQRSLSGPPVINPTGGHGLSRFSRMEFPYMPWFSDHAGSASGSRITPPTMLPSAY